MNSRAILLILVAVCLASVAAQASIMVWAGANGVGGDFGTATNWAGHVVPGVNDNPTFFASGITNPVVNIEANHTVYGFVLNGSGTMVLTSTGTSKLTITAPFNGNGYPNPQNLDVGGYGVDTVQIDGYVDASAGGIFVGGTGSGSSTLTGGGTLWGNMYIYSGTCNGNLTIHGNVSVGDYMMNDCDTAFKGKSHVSGSVTLGNDAGDGIPVLFTGGHTIDTDLNVIDAGGGGTVVTLSPHNGASGFDTLTVNHDMTLNSLAVMNFNLGAPGALGANSDDISVAHNLTLAGKVNISALAGFVGGTTYTLMTYGGTVSGSLSVGTAPLSALYAYNITTTGGNVNLNATRSATSTAWNVANGNWTTTGSWDNGVPNSSKGVFLSGAGSHAVNVDSPAAFVAMGVTNGAWSVSGNPISIGSGGLTYLSSGSSTISAKLTGTGGLAVYNGTLTLDTIAHDYSGATLIGTNGTLTVNSSIPNTTSITVNTSGTLNGIATISQPITLSGGTLGGTLTVSNLAVGNSGGVIANSPTINGTVGLSSGTLFLTGTPGGTGTWNVSGGFLSNNATLGSSHPIALTGGTLQGTGTYNNSITFSGSQTAFVSGSPILNGTLTMTSGYKILNVSGTVNGTGAWAITDGVVSNGGTIGSGHTINLSGGVLMGTGTYSGPISLSGTGILSGYPSVTYSGLVTATGGAIGYYPGFEESAKLSTLGLASGTLDVLVPVTGSGAWTVNGGTLNNTGKWGNIVIGGVATNVWFPGNIGSGHPITVSNGGIVKGSGTYNGVAEGTGIFGGSIEVDAGGSLIDSGGTYSGGVTVNGGSATMSAATLGGLVIHSGTYSGSSNINGAFHMTGGSFTGTSTINAGLGAFELDDGSFGDASTTTNITAYNVYLESGTFTGTNNVTISRAGGGLYLNGQAFNPGSAVTGGGTISGNVYMWGSSFGGAHTIVGNVQVGDYQEDGSTPTFYGTSNITGNVTVGVSGAFIGNHTIQGSFTTAVASHAIITPHNSGVLAGTLTVGGDVILDHSTTLNFNLAAPGTNGSGINDLIDITGNLSLDGTLNVTALSGFGIGTYRLFSYTGMLTGAGLIQGAMPTGLGFAYTIDTSTTGQVNLDVVTPYIPGDTDHSGGSTLNTFDIDAIYQHFGAASTSQWKVYPDTNPVGQEDVTYEVSHYMLTNYADANLDRYTDFTDFQVLLDHWQAPGGWGDGDFNGDGTVDFLDFQVLLDYWNPTGWSAGASQVPEPASLSLLLLGGLAVLRRKK